ncbi:MAG: hypothetical protein ACI9ON_003795 [Limisphaerales bacterium]|jgi:hypothetical protein
MNWDAITGVAEIVGATAVVVSLIYLASEVRANTCVMKANSSRDAQIQWAIVNEAIYQSPDRMVLAKAFDPSSTVADFSEEERHIAFFFARSILLRFESELFQYQAGLLDSEIWANHRIWCAGFTRLPFYSEWWQSERKQPVYTKSFIESIESVSGSVTTPELLRTLARPETQGST